MFPLAFATFFNATLAKLKTKAFDADDITLAFNCKTLQDAEDLDTLTSWAKATGMVFPPGKTKKLVIGKSQIDTNFSLDGAPIEPEEHIKDL